MMVRSILVLACSVFLLLTSWWADRGLYFYGQSCFNHDIGLPVAVVPDFHGPGDGDLGFMLMDEFGLPVVQKGARSRSVDISVAKVLSYSFDADHLMVLVRDELGTEHSLRLMEVKDGVVRLELTDNIDCPDCTVVRTVPDDIGVSTLERVRIATLISAALLIGVALVSFTGNRVPN